jgi:hypothetical protein
LSRGRFPTNCLDAGPRHLPYVNRSGTLELGPPEGLAGLNPSSLEGFHDSCQCDHRFRPDAGIFNIVDDEPAPVREWLPVLANVLGAKPPRHVPRWLARLIAGEAQVMIATESRGASNAKAKRELGWTLRYPSWRQGFVDSYQPAAGGPRALASK